MKKLLAFLLFALIAGVALYFLVFRKNEELVGDPEVLGLPEVDNVEVLGLSQGESLYKVAYYRVGEREVGLFRNFSARKSSTQLMTENDCEFLVNGAFYSNDFQPLGFFKDSDLQLRDFVKSTLMDGVVSLNDFDTPRITRLVPRDPLIWGLQSGPVVFENGSPAAISMKRDEYARRVLAGVTGSNELVFFILYNSESTYLGPLMGELPGLVTKLNEKTDLNLADVINLDGGSASAFIKKDGFSLNEVSPVGSFFCIQ